MNGTYTQRRRMQMAGGGITNVRPRQGYFLGGIGDFFGGIKDKIVDDLIPNEIKDSPVGAALLGGALANQFDLIPGEMSSQNWLGNLLGGQFGLPENLNLVVGDGTGLTGLTGNVVNEALQKDLSGINPEGEYGWQDAILRGVSGSTYESPGILGTIGNFVRDAAGNVVNTLTGQTADMTTGTGQDIKWKTPLAIGLAAGAAQKAMSEGDVLPQDTTGINIADIRRRALTGSDPDLHFLPPASATTAYADGGRIGYDDGGISTMMADLDAVKDGYSELIFGKPVHDLTPDELIELEMILKDKLGGPFGQKEMPKPDRVMAQEGGLMNLGGMEKDYRQEGGFVPIGGQEKADDVPARLSKNEFVFTADAVRSAGGGDIDKGAEVMENLMNHLEAGGEVSEDSQGLEGARDMFATSQRLEGVL